MTDDEKLIALKIMVGEVDTDDILSTYLNIAGQKIISRAYPYSDDIQKVPKKYDWLQLEIATYLLNKRGAEGQTTHSENGINRAYENADVPNSMLSVIIPMCGGIK